MVDRVTLDVSRRDVVVFDFDGTIADSMPSIVATATDVLREWGLPEEKIALTPQIVGPPLPHAFSLVFGVSEADARELTRIYRARYQLLGAAAWPPLPGMPELISRLSSAGKRLAVASSKRMRFLLQGLTDEGILDQFEEVQGKENDETFSKSGAIAEVLRRMGAGPDDAVMVGDRFYDVESAAEVGVPCVGVLYGKTATREELEDAGACAIARTPQELETILLGR
jgi:phosphoglycolate phosphatase